SLGSHAHAGRVARALRVGRRRGHRPRGRAGRMTAALVPEAGRPVLDAARIAPLESPWSAIRRRFAGRYPVDPFGLDPQLADLTVPLFEAAVRVRLAGGQHVPAHGP